MVLIVENEAEKAVNIKKKMLFGKDIFIRARDFYHAHEDMRKEHIMVETEDGQGLFELFFKENRIEGVPEGLNVPTYVNSYWNYSANEKNMDFSYIEEYDGFVFSHVEEYSIFMADLIKERYPEKRVVFSDKRAELFGEYTARAEGQRLLYVESHMNIGRPAKDTSSGLSVMLMASVFWASEITSFGEKNADKTFYLIKPVIGESGLAKFVEFTVGFYDLALRKSKTIETPVIPVVDTGIMGDENQFNDGSGADVWNMFFEPLGEYAPDEVYDSRHVIVSQEGNTSVNPYLLEIKRHPNVSQLIRKYVRFNSKTQKYSEDMYTQILTDSPGRVLGIVGRGTDFNHPVISKYRQKPLSPEELLKVSRERFEKGHFDKIFLATEDQHVYDIFMESSLSLYVCSVPQERYSLSYEGENGRLLADIYKEKQGERDSYAETLRYLSILYILSRCDALVASTECGATIFAEGYKKTEYEFSYIFGNNLTDLTSERK